MGPVRVAVSGRRPVLLDVDPGHDDAVAMLLALADPSLDVRAVTTVGGNAAVERTTRNALRVLALAGRADIPVAPGADLPLVRERWVPVEFHGESGLDGADLPEPLRAAESRTAIEVAADVLRSSPEPVHLVATGPLTNVALLLRAAPGLADRIAGLWLMGGSATLGNTTASAEFNIWTDPEAAAIVLGSGLPIRLAGLDVTHQALVLPPDIARIRALGTRVGLVTADLLDFFAIHHRDRYGWDGPPLHDAVAVAWLRQPSLIHAQARRVDVELTGTLTRGRTVVDEELLDGRPPNVDLALRIDRAGFIDLVVDALDEIGRGVPTASPAPGATPAGTVS